MGIHLDSATSKRVEEPALLERLHHPIENDFGSPFDLVTEGAGEAKVPSHDSRSSSRTSRTGGFEWRLAAVEFCLWVDSSRRI